MESSNLTPCKDAAGAVDRCVGAEGRRVGRYYVDSGRPDGGTPFGTALVDLLMDAQAGTFDIVVVESLGRLAADHAMAMRAAIALVAAGVVVQEAIACEVGADRGAALLQRDVPR